MFCSRCGKELPSSVTYCKYCGGKNANSAYFAQGDKGFSEPFYASQTNKYNTSYLACAIFVFVSLLALFLNWFSISLSNEASFFWLEQGSVSSSDLTILETVCLIWNVTFSAVGDNIGSQEFQSVLQGCLLCILLLGIAWVCAVGYCIAALLQTLRKQDISESFLFGAFLWVIVVSVASIILMTFFNLVFDMHYGIGSSTTMPCLLPGQGLWIALISSVCGFVFYRQSCNDLIKQRQAGPHSEDRYHESLICPLCGFKVPDEAQFCPCCGIDLDLVDLKEQKFCPICHCIIGESENTCGYCGTIQQS